jgi:hypothetical protein
LTGPALFWYFKANMSLVFCAFRRFIGEGCARPAAMLLLP